MFLDKEQMIDFQPPSLVALIQIILTNLTPFQFIILMTSNIHRGKVVVQYSPGVFQLGKCPGLMVCMDTDSPSQEFLP